MLMPTMRAAVVLFSLLGLASCNASAEKDGVARFEAALSGAHEVQLYFVKVTDAPDYSVEMMKSKAGIKVIRQCGANCRQYMKDVVAHMKAARPATCKRGDQNLLIAVARAPPVVFSHGGYQVELDGQCFLSKTSVNAVVERAEFIFG